MYKNTVVCAPTDGKQKEQESYLIIENGRIILFYVITSFPNAYKYVRDLKIFFSGLYYVLAFRSCLSNYFLLPHFMIHVCT